MKYKKNLEIFLIFLPIFCLGMIISLWQITIENSPKILFKTNSTDFLIGEEWCSNKMCFNLSEYNEFQYIIDDKNETSTTNYDNNVRINIVVTIVLSVIGLICPCLLMIFVKFN